MNKLLYIYGGVKFIDYNRYLFFIIFIFIVIIGVFLHYLLFIVQLWFFEWWYEFIEEFWCVRIFWRLPSEL